MKSIKGGGAILGVNDTKNRPVIHEETKARRISNLFATIQNHREIWTDYYHRPELWRVTDPFADVIKQPPTPQEAGFVEQVIQHTSGVYLASRNGLAIKPEGMRKDIGSFFSLPVPKAVWEKGEILQDKDFVAFVEQCFSDPR